MKRHTRWGLVEQRSVDSALVTARWRSCSGLTTTAKSTGRSRSRRMGVALLVVDPAEPPSALGTVSAQSFGAVVVGGAAVAAQSWQGAVHASDTLPHRHQDSDIVRPALTSCRTARPRKLRTRACNARNAAPHGSHGDVRLGRCGEAFGRGHPSDALGRPDARVSCCCRDVFVFDYTRHPSKPNPDGAPRRDH